MNEKCRSRDSEYRLPFLENCLLTLLICYLWKDLIRNITLHSTIESNDSNRFFSKPLMNELHFTSMSSMTWILPARASAFEGGLYLHFCRINVFDPEFFYSSFPFWSFKSQLPSIRLWNFLFPSSLPSFS